MRLLDDLRSEHDRIERTVGALRAFAELRRAGEGDPADGEAFVRFFRLFANRFHHAREEDVLFRALAEETGAPVNRGPIAAIRSEHGEMAAMVDEIEPLAGSPLDRPGEGDRLFALVDAFGRALLLHIDAENSVLFPESEERLRRTAILELPDRDADPEEVRARDDGERLLGKYPPVEIADLVRGDGCIACPSYGVRCRGVEREWWSEYEWEELPRRMGG
jgi:hemerythrin-like domain-containing protein